MISALSAVRSGALSYVWRAIGDTWRWVWNNVLAPVFELLAKAIGTQSRYAGADVAGDRQGAWVRLGR